MISFWTCWNKRQRCTQLSSKCYCIPAKHCYEREWNSFRSIWIASMDVQFEIQHPNKKITTTKTIWNWMLLIFSAFVCLFVWLFVCLLIFFLIVCYIFAAVFSLLTVLCWLSLKFRTYQPKYYYSSVCKCPLSHNPFQTYSISRPFHHRYVYFLFYTCCVLLFREKEKKSAKQFIDLKNTFISTTVFDAENALGNAILSSLSHLLCSVFLSLSLSCHAPLAFSSIELSPVWCIWTLFRMIFTFFFISVEIKVFYTNFECFVTQNK